MLARVSRDTGSVVACASLLLSRPSGCSVSVTPLDMWHLVSALRSCLADAHACRWLLAHGRAEEGEAALKKLVPGPQREGMLTELREQAEKQRKHARVPLRAALGTPELRRQLHIGDSPLGIQPACRKEVLKT